MSEFITPPIAFLIGNGPSRKPIDLEKLKEKGTVFGCNAIYRDFAPDYLVASEQAFIDEIIFSDWPVHRFLVPPLHERHAQAEGRYVNNAMSGAMLFAGQKRYAMVYILGVDSLFGSHANIYYKKPGYENAPKLDTVAVNARMASFGHIATRFKDTTYAFVIPDNATPAHKISAPNVRGMHLSKFIETFSLTQQ